MPTVNDILNALFEFAPVEGKIADDNVGLLVGSSRAEVTRVLAALDVTLEVIEEAAEFGAQLIVSHHPLIYKAVTSVTDGTVTGNRLLALLRNNIAAICMHTNLDAAPRGVNDALAVACGLTNLTLPDADSGTYPDGTRFAICRAGHLEKPTPLAEYLAFLKKSLNASGLRYHDAGRDVHHAAVTGGSGGDYLGVVHKYGCDTFITADVKHSAFLEAKDLGINLIDAGHFPTENVVTPRIFDILHKSFPGIEIKISSKHRQTERFFA